MKCLFSAICLLLIGSAHAGDTFYTDVPQDIWYEESVKAMLQAGYLDGKQQQFRPDAFATRAEVVKLVVELNGGVLTSPGTEQPFADVPVTDWYFPYFAEAKKEKWVTGDNNCAATNNAPCNARPNDVLTRAEALALIVRAFGLEGNGRTSALKDNPKESWFETYVQIAADNCVIEPRISPQDDAKGFVYPLDLLNRAEMVTMLYNIDAQQSAGTACGMQ